MATHKNIIIGLLLYILIPILYFIVYFIYKYGILAIVSNKDTLLRMHGVDSWVVITGASSGIGEKLAYDFASLGFNICIIGSLNSLSVLDTITAHTLNTCNSNVNVKTHFIAKDFNNSQQPDFFVSIESWIMHNNVSIIINNIGHRVSSADYITQSRNDIKNTINCGTLPQSIISQIAIKKFLAREPLFKSTLINITAQCFTYNLGIGSMWSPIISVPYLACYEAANAYGFYHGQSLYKEILIKRRTNPKYNNINILNITPGAVLTSRTHKSLQWIPFSCTDTTFSKGVISLIGRLEGQQCAYWGHDISNSMMLFTPFLKDYILERVGYTIASSS